jgi:hypothetical protein
LFSSLCKKGYDGTTNCSVTFIDQNSNNSKNKLGNENIIRINTYLCEKLFNCPTFSTLKENEYSPNNFDIVVDRSTLNCKNINKAFADYVLFFPAKLWADRFDTPFVSNNSFKILYASRQNTGRRLKDHSHKLLKQLIDQYKGTVIDDLSQYTIEQQVNIFRSHNCVIGVHGNNLTGMMWMKPQSHVFEILPFVDKNKVYDYHCMALCMTHQYTQINCRGKWNEIWELSDDSITYLKNSLYMLENLYFINLFI